MTNTFPQDVHTTEAPSVKYTHDKSEVKTNLRGQAVPEHEILAEAALWGVEAPEQANGLLAAMVTPGNWKEWIDPLTVLLAGTPALERFTKHHNSGHKSDFASAARIRAAARRWARLNTHHRP